MAREPNQEHGPNNPAPKGIDLTPDNLIERLGDIDDMAGLVQLAGYIGPAKAKGYARIYSDLSFSSYVEIPDDAIVSRTKPLDDDPMGKSIVYIRSGVRTKSVSVTTRSVESDYLSGVIASSYLGQSQMRGPVAPQGGVTSDPNVCTTLVCQTVSLAFCIQGQGRGPAAPQGGVTSDPNVCTTLVCQTVSLAFCIQGQGRGPVAPQGGVTSDPNVCTTLVCETVSLAFCIQGQGRGPVAPQGGVTSDPNVCTTLVCQTVSLAFCIQGQGRGPVAPQGGVTSDPNVCTTLVCETVSLAFC
ncbi:hypothetical protein NKH89_19160, partial [Mesorhizobium sp. M0923]|uniref:hypothetical protein n=1 Tax=Mesorhizobium sp. M0923 TaxID=2957028 RepID=UPI0033354538